MLKLEDVIPSIDYLISSEYITGQNIIVDGGWSILLINAEESNLAIIVEHKNRAFIYSFIINICN